MKGKALFVSKKYFVVDVTTGESTQPYYDFYHVVNGSLVKEEDKYRIYSIIIGCGGLKAFADKLGVQEFTDTEFVQFVTNIEKKKLSIGYLGGGKPKFAEWGVDFAEFMKRIEQEDAIIKERSERELAERQARREERVKHEADQKQKYAQEYERLLASQPIESTYENIRTILNHYKLNIENTPSKLPAMTIGYSCNAYDCDGKIAIAMKLDEPISYNVFDEDETSDKFVVGAPHGHLTKYTRMA